MKLFQEKVYPHTKSFGVGVYQIVRKIPRGKTLSYKEVAKRAGKPRAWRAVGNILNKNKDPKIPCHRVIRSDGTLGGYNRGQKLKARLLKKEVFLFTEVRPPGAGSQQLCRSRTKR